VDYSNTKAVSNETTASKNQNTTATFHRFLYLFFHRFFCRGVLVFYEMTTENEDLRGQFVFLTAGRHGKKTVKE
jgi:hypothetical protein